MKYTFAFLFVFASLFTEAQLPNTQAYLFDMKALTDDFFEFKSPKYLTNFNSTGYNNQPHFISDSELYMTVKTGSSNQTDIWGFNLRTKKRYKVTHTSQGEYSPGITPLASTFSCIRQVKKGSKVIQKLWEFPLNRSNNGKPVFDSVDKVGYYQWLSRYEVAMFIVGDPEQQQPHQLVIGNTRTESVKKMAKNVGRGLQQLPNGNLAYVQKESDKTWYLKELNPSTGRANILIELPDGSEDFVVMTDGSILTGKGSKLYKFNPAYNKQWLEIADFSHYGIKNITRLAYNGGRKLVIIDNKG